MERTNKKKIVIAVTGVALAMLLLVGSSLGLFARANEAESLATSQEQQVTSDVNEESTTSLEGLEQSESLAENSEGKEDDSAQQKQEVGAESAALADPDALQEVSPFAGTIVREGKSGSVDWTLDSEGTLTLGGGTMAGAAEPSQRPFGSFETNVKKVVFTDIVHAPAESYGTFSGMTSLKTIEGIEKYDVSAAQNMRNMFYNCYSLESLDVSSWDTSSATIMTGMFSNTKLTELDLSTWKTGNATTMFGMFSGMTEITSLDLSSFDTSNVTIMTNMFYGCKKLVDLDISNFNTSKLVEMSYMFLSCMALKELDLSHFDVSNVTSMQNTFYNCTSLENLNTTGWNTSKVTNMINLFTGTNIKEIDITHFNTSSLSAGFKGESSGSWQGGASGMLAVMPITKIDLTPFGGVTRPQVVNNILINSNNLAQITIPNNLSIQYIGIADQDAFELEWRQVGGDKVFADSASFMANYNGATDAGTYVREPYKNKLLYFDENFAAGTVIDYNPAGVALRAAVPMRTIAQTTARAGYKLLSWNTAADGSGDSYALGTSYTMGRNPITFYAQWQAEDQTISFVSDGAGVQNMPGNITTATDGQVDLSAAKATVPVRAGYDFLGWYDAATGGGEMPSNIAMPAGGKTYYAQWKAINQPIKFVANGENVEGMPADRNEPTDSTVDLAAELATVPTRAGYAFEGWFDATSGGAVMPSSLSVPAGGQTYYAQWEALDQTISFNGNAGTSVVTGMPADVVAVTDVSVDLSTAKATIPTRDGYAFKGWYDAATSGGEMPSDITMPAGGKTYYAQWTAVVQPITFQANADGVTKMPANTSGLTDATLDLSAEKATVPERAGYAFKGWFDAAAGGSEMPSSLVVPAGGKTYYAQWTAEEQTISFEANAKNVKNVQEDIVADTDVTVSLVGLKVPTRAGYQFKGWYDAAETGNEMPASIVMPAGGKTYYAHWQAESQTIYFDGNASNAENVPEQIDADTDTKVILSEVSQPNRAGYTFKGWYDSAIDGEKMPSDIVMPAGGKTYYAQWTADKQTITFDGNALDAKDVPTSVEKDTDSSFDVTTVSEPSRAGYSFVGWFDKAESGTQVGTITVPVGGVTYYAYWQAEKQTIVFNGNAANAANVPASVEKDTDSSFDVATVSEPSRPGYKFLGWFDKAENGAQVGVVTVPAGGATYYANWQALDQTISFYGNGTGATDVPSDIVKTTDTTVDLSQIAQASRPGYTFKGWYDAQNGGTEMPESLVMPAGGQRYYAQWEADSQSISFKENGENVVNMPDPIAADTDVTVPLSAVKTPSRVGYDFAGWYDAAVGGSGMPSSIVMPDGGKTYYAQWTAISYDVQFVGNGSTSGAMANQSFVYDTDQALTDNIYTRTGYTFAGWNTQADGNGTSYANQKTVKNLSVVKNSTVQLFAQWKANRYTVVFDGNGATSGAMQVQEFTYDIAQNLEKNIYQREKYEFTGWNTQADVNGQSYTDENSILNLTANENGSITLFAQWVDTYTLTAKDFVIDINDVDALTDEIIKDKAEAKSVTNDQGLPAAVNIVENKIEKKAGTFAVKFESNGQEKTIKVTVQSEDNITVASTEAIQASNIGLKSTEVQGMTKESYITKSGASAWLTDFSNDEREIVKVDSSRVLNVAGTYEIYYYTAAQTAVKAYVAVTDAENGTVANQEAIQADNFMIPLNESGSLNQQKYLDESHVVAWKANQAGKVLLDGINVLDTAVDKTTAGTYKVTYQTNTTAQTSVDGYVTIYDTGYHVSVDFEKNEAFEARDFVIDAKELPISESEYITKSNAHGWTTDNQNNLVVATSADFSAVKPEKGVYPVEYKTSNGSKVVAYVSVGDGDVVSGDGLQKTTLQANHFTVTGTEVQNGISPEKYIQKGSASAWSWNDMGVATPITNIAVEDGAVLPTAGTYPITYKLLDGTQVTAMVTVKTADEITVDMGKNEAIQANNFQVKLFEVIQGTVDGQYCFDTATPTAWSTDGNNTPINIDMGAIDFSQVGQAVGHYPVTFQTDSTLKTKVTIDVEVVANDVKMVTFDGNGATTQAIPNTIGVEEPLTTIGSLPSQNPERTGFTFKGWNTKNDGTGVDFVQGSSVSAPMTVYAKWEKNQYTLHFDTQNEETNPSDQVIFYGDLASKPALQPTKKGHSFIGWFTGESDGVYWDFASSTMPAAETTLYAHYSVNEYIVTFDERNAGDDSNKNFVSVPYGAKVQAPQAPFLYGYTFLGWTDEDGKLWDFATQLMPDNHITLYAQWEHTVYTLTYLTYDLNEIETQTFYAGDELPQVYAPRVGGHTWQGWDEMGTDTRWSKFSALPNRNLTLVAVYDKNPEVLVSSSSSTASKPTSSVTKSTVSAGSVIQQSQNSVLTDSSSTISDEVTTATTSTSASSGDVVLSGSVNSGGNGNQSVVVDRGNWSLLNLIVSALAAIMGIFALVLSFKKKKSVSTKISTIVAAIIGIGILVGIIVVSNFSGQMILFNNYTLLVLADLIIQGILLFFTRGKKVGEYEDEI